MTNISPSEGSPSKQASDEATEAHLKELEAHAETESYNTMAAQVPPNMQKAFLEKHPPPPAIAYPPVDEEDVRQSESKRGTPAPNEPTEYVDQQGNPIDPTVLPPEKVSSQPVPPSQPVAPGQPGQTPPPIFNPVGGGVFQPVPTR